MGKLLLALVLPLALAAHAEELPRFKIELADGKISPQRLDVPAGKKFQLEVRNSGKTAAEFESKALKKEKVVAPGATTLLTINALAAGEYKFVEEYHEKDAAGQGVIVAK